MRAARDQRPPDVDGLQDRATTGRGVGEEGAEGVFKKQPFVDDESFWRPAGFFACVFVGKVYLEGRRPSDLPLSRPA